jgi:hypothetical protein
MRAMLAGALAVRVGVLHAHDHRVRHLVRARRPAVVAHVGNDDSTVLSDPELRPVGLPDPHTLTEAEGPRQPVDGLAHVRVDEVGDDGGLGNRAVRLERHPRERTPAGN